MITRADEPRGSGRIVRIALVSSIVAHLLVVLLFIAAADGAKRLFERIDPHHPVKKLDDETVTLSTALHIEKRAKPATAGGKPKAVAVQRPTRPRPQVRPAPREVAQAPRPVVVPKPVYHPPLTKRELAKIVPRAKSEPPTASPATPQPAKQIAALQRPTQATQAERSSRPAQLSQAQIAKIESDLAKTIAKARAEAGPLSDTRKRTVAASTRRYALDFSGVGQNLRHAQGVCHPIKSWQMQGWDYYYDTCEVQEPDGTVTEKALPWPVRYRPQADPNLGTGPDPAPVLPVPGWHPDPNQAIDPDFIPFLRENGFSV